MISLSVCYIFLSIFNIILKYGLYWIAMVYTSITMNLLENDVDYTKLFLDELTTNPSTYDKFFYSYVIILITYKYTETLTSYKYIMDLPTLLFMVVIQYIGIHLLLCYTPSFILSILIISIRYHITFVICRNPNPLTVYKLLLTLMLFNAIIYFNLYFVIFTLFVLQ